MAAAPPTGDALARSGVPFLDLAATTREVRGDVAEAWAEIVSSGRFVGGPAVEQFEREWADYCGAEHAVAVANGTDALHLVLRSLGIGPGDEVIVPANTFVATAEAVVLAGARPSFADVDARTLLMTPETMAAAVTPRTSAVMVVHLYGQMADMRGINSAAAAAGIVVVEDAAQAHGASRDGLRAGAAGRAAGFSFYPGKNLGAFGDGGAVTTSDAQLAGTLRVIRDHGRTPGSHYAHEAVGTNSRLDALQAAVLSAKLRRLDAWNAARRTVMAQYRDGLDGTGVDLVPDATGAVNVHHLAVARVPSRDRVSAELARQGIQTSVHYPVPCHQQAPYAEFAREPLPVAEAAAAQVLSLPMYPSMTAAQVDQVCSAVRSLPSEWAHSDAG
jgi:dTDP-4-amino-4,6-dideoxygalactose transaminase